MRAFKSMFSFDDGVSFKGAFIKAFSLPKDFFSVKNAFKTRSLVVMSLMIALRMVLTQFDIYITPYFKFLSFGYLPGALVSVLYGPIMGISFGFIGDFVGYISRPEGLYFPGFAAGEMLANFIYAFFMYKKNINWLNVLLSRIFVLLTVTFGINFLCLRFLYDTTASGFFTGVRFITNTTFMPLHIFLLLLFGRLTVSLENRRASSRL
jgi:ECF transporter S component (folate family)